MNTSTLKVRILLILLFISVMPFTHAQGETEYLGIIVAEGPKDDKKYGSFPIGFDFDFFGNTYNEFYVSSNGLVMFGAGSNAFSNVSIPDESRPDNYIAPFWDDLIIHTSGDIMYQTIGSAPNRKLVIQFSNMSFWTSTVLLGTIQVILYEGSNNIQMQYKSIVDLSSDRASGGEATVGLENIDGTAGVLCSYNTAGYIYSGRAILFTPSGLTYTYDENALYENVLLVNDIPKAGIPNLVSPTHNSSVEETVTFLWEAASHASSYFVLISQNADLSSPIHTSADLTDLSYEYTLVSGQTYYWSANAKNSSGDISWSEIWSFKTTSTPALLAVPQTMHLEQGDLQILPLLYTGGDGGPKTATISSLPVEGTLYQNNAGVPGTQITTVPTDVTDPFISVIYSANGATGNGVGSFNFHFTDGTGSSSDVSYTINVSPPGIPNFMYASKETDRVEISFDRPMADPTGLHLEFAVEDNGVGVTTTTCALKAGDPNTIVVYVSPNLNTTNAITVAYTRGTVTAASGGILESFDFQLAGRLAQTITFDVLTDKNYGDPDYTLVATASSGLPVTFSSSNTTVVSVSVSTATVNNPGEAYISAFQAGDASYAPVSFERYQLVNKAAATITLSDLAQGYTGSGLSATATTVPPGLLVIITYDGSTDLPVDFGSYAVMAQIIETNYSGTASDILSISDLTAPVPDVATLPTLIDECAVTPAAPTATDLNAGQITGTTGTPFPITTMGTTIITWTYDDGFGNISTQTQSVVLNDVNDPVTPTLTDQALECSSPAVPPTTTDNCAGTITGTTSDPVSYSTQGMYVINWTFDDGNGNSVVVAQNVIVTDGADPVIPTLADLTGECSVTAVVPTTTDACAGTITGTTTDPLTYSTQGTYVINWTFDDGNGNSIVAAQNVIVDDLTPPVAPTLADLTGECSVTAVVPTTTDACAGTITGITTDPLTYSAQGTHVINWTFDDGNGNSIVVAQNVIVDDVTDPVIPTLPDVFEGCSTSVTAPTTTDACAGIITGTTTDPMNYSTMGIHVINWTFDDGNGNSISAPQNVTVVDVTDPVIPTLADVTGDCSVTVTAPTTTDNCAGIITGTTSDPMTYTSKGNYVITWTFDDGNGNAIQVTQNVIVVDVAVPVIPTLADVTGECSATATVPSTTDACAGIITGTTTDPLTYSTQGSFVINWTFDDGFGNNIVVAQNVIVTDITPPTATAPADVVTCDGTVSSIGLANVNDNCTTPVVTYELSGATTGSGSGDNASGAVFAPGVTTVTYTLDDGNGNSSQYQLTVTYQVVDAIVVTVDAGSLSCETSGTYQWISCADNSIIPDETASSFRPGVNGEYAVILTQGGCSDTSDCYMLDYTGIDDARYQDYKVYPNPAHDYVNIDLTREHTNVSIKVFDMTGNLLKIEEFGRITKTELDITEFKAGLYMIHIHSDQVNSVSRIIKE
jgi:hypothetical protein